MSLKLKVLSDDKYFIKGVVSCTEILDAIKHTNTHIIDFKNNSLKQALIFIEKNEFTNLLLYCNDVNLLPLAVFLKKRNRKIDVWCNYGKLFIEANTYLKVNSEITIVNRSIIKINDVKVKVRYKEFDLLNSIAKEVGIEQYLLMNKMSRSAYYKTRRELMKKLRVNISMIYSIF